jgi:hypothetical protein
VDPFVALARALLQRGARFVVIGVWGASSYAQAGSVLFETRDRELFLPPDPDNLLNTWGACEAVGLSLWAESEPLDPPSDRWLADRIVTRRAVVRATDGRGLDVDLTLVMAGFDFETVCSSSMAWTSLSRGSGTSSSPRPRQAATKIGFSRDTRRGAPRSARSRGALVPVGHLQNL